MIRSGNAGEAITLVRQPISIPMYRHLIEDVDVGAHAWFEGVTRRMTGNRQTETLAYEAFEPMALAELEKIRQETISEFQLTKLVIFHRLGSVPIGEASLIVGCSAPHRTSVFAAIAKVVDRLKVDVPIWKKEFFVDGEQQWVHPT